MVLDIIALVCSVVLPVTLFFLGRRLDSKDKKKDRQPKFVIHASGVMPREKQTTITIQNIGEDAFLTNVRVKTEEFKCLTGLNEYRVQKEDDFTLTFEYLGRGNLERQNLCFDLEYKDMFDEKQIITINGLPGRFEILK